MLNKTYKLLCTLPQAESSYEIEIGNGLIADSQTLYAYLKTLAARFAIICDDTTAALYGEKLSKELSASGLEAFLFTFPSGERSKTRETKELIENQMFEHGLGRDSCVIAVGGGVVTDVAGFLAATYCRGIPLVLIPTTLLCMIDACIGGKSGVNVAYGKNLIGTIYQPKKIFIDTALLHSLPKNELRYGAVEMIKHGLIADLKFFTFLETHCEAILALDPDVIEKAIVNSCHIKIAIVEADERESHKRVLLNLGHTVAHALERLTDYAMPHGEAVAIGLWMEGAIAVELGHLKASSFKRIEKILDSYGLPKYMPPEISMGALYQAMTSDKKSLQGVPRFVLLAELGSPMPCGSSYCAPVDKAVIEKIYFKKGRA